LFFYSFQLGRNINIEKTELFPSVPVPVYMFCVVTYQIHASTYIIVKSCILNVPCLALVAHTCNPSYLADWDQANHSSRPVQSKRDFISMVQKIKVLAHACHTSNSGKNKIEWSRSRLTWAKVTSPKWRARGVAQVIGNLQSKHEILSTNTITTTKIRFLPSAKL
jgi:hypothetical protein